MGLGFPVQFLDNKYRRWYFKIIDEARTRVLDGYSERHHILPKALGGRTTYNSTICVRLTAREHFLCHWLLTKFTTGEAKMRMCFALHRLNNLNGKHAKVVAGWQYELARKKHREALTGRKWSDEERARRSGVNSPLYGRKRRPEDVEKMIASKRANPFRISDEHRERIREVGRALVGEKNPFFGRKHSEETRQKMRARKLTNHPFAGKKRPGHGAKCAATRARKKGLQP
jgi:hypothetical protein